MNSPLTPHGLTLLNRRAFQKDFGSALGGISLLQLLARDGLLAAEKPVAPGPIIDSTRPAAARTPQFPAQADQLLIIYCAGAVSHVDSWDYKPELYKHHGQMAPDAPKVTFMGPVGKLAKPLWEFKPRGQSGKQVSELFPKLAGLATRCVSSTR